MIVLPEICSLERIARGVRLQTRIPADLGYFAGHFSNCPLLPGVVQIDWAIDFGRRLVPFHGTFRALVGVKFMRVIQPEESITLTLQYANETRQLDFAYALGDRACSSGGVLFD